MRRYLPVSWEDYLQIDRNMPNPLEKIQKMYYIDYNWKMMREVGCGAIVGTASLNNSLPTGAVPKKSLFVLICASLIYSNNNINNYISGVSRCQ